MVYKLSEEYNPTGNVVHSIIAEQHAEMALIRNLLGDASFDKGNLKFLLAKYPNVSIEEKGDLICKIMNQLWNEHLISNYFEVFREFEKFLTLIGKRDHFFHQFLVYLIGINTLQLLLKNFPSENDRESVFGFKEERHIFFTWLLAASTHDFGYPYQYVGKIAGHLGNLYNSFHMDELGHRFSNINIPIDIGNENELLTLKYGCPEHGNEAINMADVLKDTLKSKLKLGDHEVNDLCDLIIKDQANDHGYVSALVLCQNVYRSIFENKGCIGFPGSVISQSLQYAMSAVAVHNVASNEFLTKITHDKNIYAFLLFIIDNIQDWYRAHTYSDIYPNFHLVKFSRKDSDSEIVLEYIIVSENWTPTLVNSINENIIKKRELLQVPASIGKKLGFNISVKYHMIRQPKPEEIAVSY